MLYPSATAYPLIITLFSISYFLIALLYCICAICNERCVASLTRSRFISVIASSYALFKGLFIISACLTQLPAFLVFLLLALTPLSVSWSIVLLSVLFERSTELLCRDFRLGIVSLSLWPPVSENPRKELAELPPFSVNENVIKATTTQATANRILYLRRNK